MKSSHFLRRLAICGAAALFASCGSPGQLPMAAAPPIAAPQGKAAQKDLLYVSNGSGTVDVFRYWQRSLRQVLTGFRSPKGECVDAAGDVYITDSKLRKIFEYEHGGDKPLHVLRDAQYAPYGCSVDPGSGDLAVANNAHKNGGPGGIAIYQQARGMPKIYAPIKYLYSPISCSYDESDNLFVASLLNYSGYLYATFAYLPKGAKQFINVTLSEVSSSDPFQDVAGVQWDGQYWAVEYDGAILRYSIDAEGNATFQGYVTLNGNAFLPFGQFWITNFHGGSGPGTQIVTVEPAYSGSGENAVRFWRYPAGGDAVGTITRFLNEPYGVTVSRRPSK